MEAGTQIRLKSDPGRQGTCTGKTISRAAILLIQVRFPDGIEYVPEDQLEIMADLPDHPLDLMKKGKTRELVSLIPDFTEQAVAETDSGALTWLMSALDFPRQPASIHGYGSVIGSGNVVAEWNMTGGGGQ